MKGGGQHSGILAGTYRRECKEWILSNLLYNYPAGDGAAALPFDPAEIGRIDLCNRNTPPLRFKSSFQRFVGSEELRGLGYPAGSRPHARKYALFSLTPLAGEDAGPDRGKAEKRKKGPASRGRLPIARLEDFAETGDEQAYLTHWLHNRGAAAGRPYEKRARALLPGDAFGLPDEDGGDDGDGDDGDGGFRACERAGRLFFPEIFDVPFPPPERPRFTFIDLFAGIGGFRIAMQECGGKCVFSSEWDAAAQKTYLENFGEMPFGDITKRETKDAVPGGFDILCAGFPCQAFSIAGYRKGFNDTRGTLFFDVAQILSERRPRAFFLENVKNLEAHDGGRTFRTILRVLEQDLGYTVFHKVMNTASYVDVPQNRERVFIVGFDPGQVPGERIAAFAFPEKTARAARTIHDCIDYGVDDERFFYREGQRYYAELSKAMRSGDTVYQWRRKYVRENKSRLCPTLTANMGAGGHNVPLIRTPLGIRKLTPRECLNFQGFPERYRYPGICLSKQYMQAGNSVTVPMIKRVADRMMEVLCFTNGST